MYENPIESLSEYICQNFNVNIPSNFRNFIQHNEVFSLDISELKEMSLPLKRFLFTSFETSKDSRGKIIFKPKYINKDLTYFSLLFSLQDFKKADMRNVEIKEFSLGLDSIGIKKLASYMSRSNTDPSLIILLFIKLLRDHPGNFQLNINKYEDKLFITNLMTKLNVDSYITNSIKNGELVNNFNHYDFIKDNMVSLCLNKQELPNLHIFNEILGNFVKSYNKVKKGGFTDIKIQNEIFQDKLNSLYNSDKLTIESISYILPEYLEDTKMVFDLFEKEEIKAGVKAGASNCDLNNLIKESIESNTSKQSITLNMKEYIETFVKVLTSGSIKPDDLPTMISNESIMKLMLARKSLMTRQDPLYVENLRFMIKSIDDLKNKNVKIDPAIYSDLEKLFNEIAKVSSRVYNLSIVFGTINELYNFFNQNGISYLCDGEENQISLELLNSISGLYKESNIKKVNTIIEKQIQELKEHLVGIKKDEPKEYNPKDYNPFRTHG